MSYSRLILSLIQILSDTSAADSFLKTWRQKKKLLKMSNFSFCHHVFNSIHLKGFFLCFCLDVCKVVCSRCVVCGKAFKHQNYTVDNFMFCFRVDYSWKWFLLDLCLVFHGLEMGFLAVDCFKKVPKAISVHSSFIEGGTGSNS